MKRRPGAETVEAVLNVAVHGEAGGIEVPDVHDQRLAGVAREALGGLPERGEGDPCGAG